MRVDSNKVQLFRLLNNELIKATPDDRIVIVTEGEDVICKPLRDKSNMAPCNHEEADSRIMVHIADAVSQGCHKILVRTVDTDVVVLAVATVQSLENVELWILFGSGKDLRYIPVHEISVSLGPQKSYGLPVFHAFTGCDTVSQFSFVGKKTAWKVWETHMEFDEVFSSLSRAPQQLNAELYEALENFTILL